MGIIKCHIRTLMVNMTHGVTYFVAGAHPSTRKALGSRRLLPGLQAHSQFSLFLHQTFSQPSVAPQVVPGDMLHVLFGNLPSFLN